MLLQKSLSEFVTNRPNKAKELGITADSENNIIQKDDLIIMEESEESDSGCTPKRRTKNKKSIEEDEDEFIPDKFESLVGNKKRRKEEKADPVIVKPKLRRVEKKFVPVLEKLSINEITEINTYQQFNRTLDHVMKTAEEIDFSEISTRIQLLNFSLSNVLLL